MEGGQALEAGKAKGTDSSLQPSEELSPESRLTSPSETKFELLIPTTVQL